MLNQSFRQVFVANTGVLLQTGTTVDLAAGQVGIFDANTYSAVGSPTYGQNKAIQIWLGMPDVSHLPLMAGIPQTNQSSKLIKGKKLKKIRRKTAARGQNQQVVIGFDGIDTTKNLTAKCGEVRTVYVKLSGNPIDKLYSKQGLIRQYRLDTGCCDDCGGDNCADVAPETLADALVEKINSDPKWNGGGGQLIRAKKILSEALDTSGSEEYTEYSVSIADAGDVESLSTVQVQYPQKAISRIERSGIISTYYFIQPTADAAPADFTNAGIFTIADCGTCPAGYTLNASGYIYKVVRADAGNAGAITTLNTDYGIAAAGESSARIQRDSPNGISTYLIVSNSASQAAVGSDEITALGEASGKCVLTTPSTTAWVAGDTLYALPKVYQITLADDVCGTSRLAELQAAYPDLVITQLADGPSDCIHGYETTIYSTPVATDCSVDQIVFPVIPSFEGVSWKAETATPSTVEQAGVIIETAFVNRTTNDCTFDYYPYEADVVHMEVSEYNADYNGSPCEDRWPVTELRGIKYPVGVGQYVREQEKKSLSYFLLERSADPAVREAEGYVLFTDPHKFYDEFTIEFDFNYKVLGWSETYEDSYHLVIYVPEGAGATLQQGLLSYANSVGHDVDIELN
jgi:hypothetical protein